MIDRHHGWNASTKPVILGFVFSLVLTLAAFRVVTHFHLNEMILLVTVLALASLQAVVQLIFYLHLGLEESPRWNMMMFVFMALIIFVLIAGSIWIMKNIDYNLMPGMKS